MRHFGLRPAALCQSCGCSYPHCNSGRTRAGPVLYQCPAHTPAITVQKVLRGVAAVHQIHEARLAVPDLTEIEPE